MSAPSHLIFVYGTLKRGLANHHLLADQQFVGPARTAPGLQLYQLDGYPGMVADPQADLGVTGELWRVDPACLARLDELEGLAEGLYRRERIRLAPPDHEAAVEAYLYARSVTGRPLVGSTWPPV